LITPLRRDCQVYQVVIVNFPINFQNFDARL